MYLATAHLFTSIYFSPPQKKPSGVQAISAGDIAQPRFGEQQDIHFFYPHVWSYGKIITWRNYVSADMEYSSKRSEEDSPAHESLKSE